LSGLAARFAVVVVAVVGLDPELGVTAVDTTGDLLLEPQEAKITRSEDERGYRVRIEKQVVGRINGGDTEFRIKTYNGDIYVRKSGG